MRVILEPLIGDVPIVGAVTMFFIRRPVRPSYLRSLLLLLLLHIISPSSLHSTPSPRSTPLLSPYMGTLLSLTLNVFLLMQKLVINWTGLTNLLDIPGLK